MLVAAALALVFAGAGGLGLAIGIEGRAPTLVEATDLASTKAEGNAPDPNPLIAQTTRRLASEPLLDSATRAPGREPEQERAAPDGASPAWFVVSMDDQRCYPLAALVSGGRPEDLIRLADQTGEMATSKVNEAGDTVIVHYQGVYIALIEGLARCQDRVGRLAAMGLD